MNDNDFDPEEELVRRFNPIPCLITLCNAFCGFASVVFALTSYLSNEPIPHACIWMLLGAMIFDTLDGMAARMLNAKSLLGANLDSLADAISFGVAPAAVVLTAVTQHLDRTDFTPPLVWIVVLFYLACTLWRLARYNVQAAGEKNAKGYFTGLPSPAAASIVCSAVLLLPSLNLSNHLLVAGYLFYTFMAGILMVSRIPYPHARRCVSGEPRILSYIFIAVVLGSIVVFRVKALVAWAHIYLLAAPLFDWQAKRLARKAEAELARSNASSAE